MSVSDELLQLAETASMPDGTRTRIRDAALKVAALEREHRKAVLIAGLKLMDEYQREQNGTGE
jgi:hypothetical protein